METEQVDKNNTVLWQDLEKAVLIRRWSGIVEIKQGCGCVLIEDENAKEFLKLLKEFFSREAVTK